MGTLGSTCRGWESLEEELAAWAGSGRVATFWWRDDDAAAPAAALGRLCDLASSSEVPLTLAVIPGRLRPGPAEGLAEVLADAPTVRVAQHGFDHTNHASGRGSGGASELCLRRGIETVLAELANGWSRLEAAFPGRLAPLLVPPWNRIDAAIVGALPSLGYRGLSTFGPRAAVMPAPGLTQVNAHCDPIRWKERGRFAGLSACLGAVVGQLRANRLGPADAAQPVGLLTHHLDLDEDAWAFTAEFLDRVSAHPAAAFAAVDALLMAE
jgi:hypothetical protein